MYDWDFPKPQGKFSKKKNKTVQLDGTCQIVYKQTAVLE